MNTEIKVGSAVIIDQDFRGRPAGTVFTVRKIDSDDDCHFEHNNRVIEGYIHKSHVSLFAGECEMLSRIIPADDLEILKKMDGFTRLSLAGSAVDYIVKNAPSVGDLILDAPVGDEKEVIGGVRIGDCVKIISNNNMHDYRIGCTYRVVAHESGGFIAEDEYGVRGNYLEQRDVEIVSSGCNDIIKNIFSERTRELLKRFNGYYLLFPSRNQIVTMLSKGDGLAEILRGKPVEETGEGEAVVEEATEAVSEASGTPEEEASF